MSTPRRRLAFRAAKESDLDRLVEIHRSAYPDPRATDERRRRFTTNVLGALSDLRVAEDDGEIVAQGFLYSLEVHVGGRAARAGAIASLAVAPEARARGFASELLSHLHRESDVRGDAFTLLYPYRQGFYARHGYAPTSSYKRLAITPRAIPASFHAAREHIHIRAARGTDRDAIEHLHERAALRGTGMIKRPRALWDRLFTDESRTSLVADRNGTLTGYVAWRSEQAEPHAATRLLVNEMCADDEPTRRALFSALRDQRDQVCEIEVELAWDDPIDAAFIDGDALRFGTEEVEHTLGTVAAGPMVRVEDISRAIEGRGYALDGAIDVIVTGDDLATHVRVEDGRATAGPAQGGAQVRVDRAALAAILYGGLRVTSAARVGWLLGDDSAIRRAEALFATPPFFAIDPF